MKCMSAAGAFWMALSVMGAMAQAPELINSQGRLIEGTNLANRTVAMVLRFYDAPAGGALLYADSNSVQVVDGLYSTLIGDNTISGALTSLFGRTEVYLETEVAGVALAPRERVTSAAYALQARGVMAGGITAPMLADRAVTAAALADGSITSNKLAAGSVTAAALGAGAVTSNALAAGAVDTVALADGAIASN